MFEEVVNSDHNHVRTIAINIFHYGGFINMPRIDSLSNGRCLITSDYLTDFTLLKLSI
jgi:hypothetical protein